VTLKGELVDRQPWRTRTAGRRASVASIGTWYNRRRQHPILGNLSQADERVHATVVG
jgi:hypothetical protein